VGNLGIVELMGVERSERDVAWLQQALQSAVELEFSTIPVYLSGMWSIQDQSGEVYDLVNSVVLEEMLHMGLACNMLRGIGGAPQITPPVYPGPLPGGVRPGLEVYLAGLSPATVEMYMQIEQPEHPVTADGDGYPTIGAFYDAILAAFQTLSPPISPSGQLTAELSVDVPDPPGPDKSIQEDLTPVGSVGDVEQAIATIKDQGEGTALSPDAPEYGGELAHYYRFGEIYHGRHFVPTPEGWQWAGDPVEFPACYPVARVPAGGYPDVPESQAFDQAFAELVGHLENAWGTGGQSELDQAIGMMFRLYDLAQALVTKPLPGGGDNYGPDFIPASASA
jgi:Ferritin-like